MDKVIHFGEFVRWHRLTAGKTTEALARELGITARRLIAIEAMGVPDVQHTTLLKLAKVFDIDPEQFDQTWRSTPVPVTRRKAGPTTDEAQRFAAACRLAGVAPADGMRRLRSWIVAQSAEVQKEALGFERPAFGAPHAPQFSQLVDHLQDPADGVRKRVGRRAANSAKRPGSASTSEHKRR